MKLYKGLTKSWKLNKTMPRILGSGHFKTFRARLFVKWIMYTSLWTICKEECYVSISLQIRQKHLKLIDLLSILYITPYDMAKVFKSGTETQDESIYCLYYVLHLTDMGKVFKSGTERSSDII